MTKTDITSAKTACCSVQTLSVSTRSVPHTHWKTRHGAHATSVLSTQSAPHMRATDPPWYRHQRCLRSPASPRALLSASIGISSTGERRATVAHGRLYRWQGRLHRAAHIAAVVVDLSRTLYPCAIRLSVQVSQSPHTAMVMKKGECGREEILALALDVDITVDDQVDAADDHGCLSHAARVEQMALQPAARAFPRARRRWQPCG